MISVKLNSYSFKKEINSAILSQASMQNSEKEKKKKFKAWFPNKYPPAQEVRFDDAEQNQMNPKLNRIPSEPADQLNSLIS